MLPSSTPIHPQKDGRSRHCLLLPAAPPLSPCLQPACPSPLWLWLKLLQALTQAQAQGMATWEAATCHSSPQLLLCSVQQVLAGLQHVDCVEVVQQQLLTHTPNTSTTVCSSSAGHVHTWGRLGRFKSI